MSLRDFLMVRMAETFAARARSKREAWLLLDQAEAQLSTSQRRYAAT
jgi:hypothetical protein